MVRAILRYSLRRRCRRETLPLKMGWLRQLPQVGVELRYPVQALARPHTLLGVLPFFPGRWTVILVLSKMDSFSVAPESQGQVDFQIVAIRDLKVKIKVADFLELIGSGGILQVLRQVVQPFSHRSFRDSFFFAIKPPISDLRQHR